MRYLSSASPNSSPFAVKLKAFGRFLHRICGPDKNIALMLTQGFLLYQQDIDDSEDTDDSEGTDDSEDTNSKMLERAIKIVDPKCI